MAAYLKRLFSHNPLIARKPLIRVMYRKLERFPLCNHDGALSAASPHRLAANRLYGDTDAADTGFVVPRVAGLVRVAAQSARRCLDGILHLGCDHAVVELADEDLKGQVTALAMS